MKLEFLGTRGNVGARSRRHRRHASLLVSFRRRRVMVDCGADWLGRLSEVDPHAVVLTHAHPDHADGLAAGAPCPIYASPVAWERLAAYPVAGRRVLPARRVTVVEGIAFQAFPVEHSRRAPAVGYRIEAGRASVFYVPDVADIHGRQEALRGVRIYIGDGATVVRSMVRRQGDSLIGHAPIRAQLAWCQEEGVEEAIFTHCGSAIVAGDERSVGARVRAMAGERGVQATIACDGMERVLR